MPLTPGKINTFLLFKLPAAYITGVRVQAITSTSCVTRVKHRWINQNPFRSMFWAVQGIAAELSTGALVMAVIKERKQPISMLVVSNKATFSKKAKGKITFTCTEGSKIKEAIETALQTGEGQSCWMTSRGVDEAGDEVSVFQFQWTVKPK